MKIFKGDLVLRENTTFKEDIKVEGNIRCEGGRWNITAGNVDAMNIYAGNVDAGNVDVGTIDAENVYAWNITAGTIDAENVDAKNIDVGTIDAGNISYYAFCIAYRKITCNKIAGRRENSFHKCLDGKLTIRKKEDGKR